MGDEPAKVLIVDDHKVVADGLVLRIGQEPEFDVVGAAATLAEAMRLVEREHPDVVILDISLPDGSGIDGCAAIKQHHPQTHVVILTASEDDVMLTLAIEAGCSGYLTKDRAMAEVVKAVRTALEGEMVVSPDALGRLLGNLRPQRDEPSAKLTEREMEILHALAEGKTNRQIATDLFLSVNTIRNHVQRLLEKLDAHSKLEAVAVAVRRGIIKR